jgi:hypothetical protein
VHPLDHRAQRCDHRLHLVVKSSGQLTKYALIATEPTGIVPDCRSFRGRLSPP